MFKKIYVEITNTCNLNCSFCIHTTRNKGFITIEKFKDLLKKLNGYTKYLYFHVLGEPLLHPQINELIDIAYQENYFINLTTNGYLISKVEKNKNIRQINISLHSYSSNSNKTLEQYLLDIVSASKQLVDNGTIINYRLWTKSPYQQQIIDFLNEYYHVDIKLQKGFKIEKNIFIEEDKEFIWPDINNNVCNYTGNCHALKDHIGILVDGTVVPCCLDSQGTINLGNIYQEELNDILKQERVVKMINGFKENKRVENLCKHCTFNQR